ncbi:Fascin-like incomplete domain containing protein [Pandoravirus macleodensis]|uniref:Fascin-like incomplete domain containing protein n=1 Tax=Pandoravirus macleodensis TaxID=2107707 RepID=A0A2U7UG10_9VIRU|nr:Fascin-like incomplete domain containing protein [Pandoravirus macleodensis]AVK77404.1 Fascin-like incomplete domain containing protein [Pandoravirus macleodensis]
MKWKLAIFVLAFWLSASSDAYRHTTTITTSQTTWALPAGASNVSVTLWGGGGGSSTSRYCGASGGSGAAIIDRPTGVDAWNLSTETIKWTFVVGGGGDALPATNYTTDNGGVAGNGGNTIVVATAPGGVELFRATAYGGGGGTSARGRTRCQGGGGGGAASAANGPVAGGGTPSGSADDNRARPPSEGAMIGDVKAGGSGAGYAFANGTVMQPYVRGASWTSPERSWLGGNSSVTAVCFGWGGAAGYNGDGGSMQGPVPQPPPPNSGSGAGSATVCDIGVTYVQPYAKYYSDMAGAAGGIVIAFDHPMLPTPSVSPTPSLLPSRSPSRSPTPSVTASPTPQPFTQLITLVSPISGKQLTPQDDGSVKSLWYGASYKEKWTVARLSNGKYTLRGFNGRYLGANPGGWVRADATAVGSWEQWDILINAGNQWTLKSVHGTYMGTTVAGVIYLNGDSTLYWTKTTV